MNVIIKPLVWSLDLSGTVGCDTVFGGMFIYKLGNKWAWGASRGETGGSGFAYDDDAMDAAERWYIRKVLDCLEPADRDAVDAFAKLRGE